MRTVGVCTSTVRDRKKDVPLTSSPLPLKKKKREINKRMQAVGKISEYLGWSKLKPLPEDLSPFSL